MMKKRRRVAACRRLPQRTERTRKIRDLESFRVSPERIFNPSLAGMLSSHFSPSKMLGTPLTNRSIPSTAVSFCKAP